MAKAPKDFSSMVVRPPAMLPRVGCEPLISSPVALILASIRSTICSSFLATSLLAARLASRWVAPITSVVSEKMAVPPSAISLSKTCPVTALPEMPEVAFEAPHFTPKVRWLRGKGFLCIWAARDTMRRAVASPLSSTS